MTYNGNRQDSQKSGRSASRLTTELGKLFLGWRSLFLGCCGTVAGFVGAITNSGIGVRISLLAIGCASLALAVGTLKFMEYQKNNRSAPRR
ncbi:hypothetical protein [Streptomyces lunalinharesii]|uniref:Uncharacterized protein n=1 Tax=Streptomyces lunalinharesii TaxID=333384 RepID=A0ABN3T0D6_9ACTN